MPRTAPEISVGTVNLDRGSQIPLHRQLYSALRDKIISGLFTPGDRLPSTRALSEELVLGRNTVVSAYNELIAEGFLDSETGSGTIVSRSLPVEMIRDEQVGSPSAAGPPATGRNVSATELPPQPGVSAGETPQAAPLDRNPEISERGKGLLGVPYLEETRLVPFTPAYPAIDERFVTTWGTLMSKAWRRMNRNQFGYPSAVGYHPLREAIASYLRSARGVKCVARQVVITDGAQQALNIIAQLLLNPGESAWIEDPSYDGAKAAFQSVGARIVPVPVDQAGFDVEAAAARNPEARIAYISPSNQFPLGVTMDLNRRLQLSRWAEEHRGWIIEDDYDSEFRYGGQPVMSLQGMDRSERVIYVGTFSKVLFPGLRLGYLVAPLDLIDPMHSIRAHADRGSPLFEQIVLNDYIRQGHFARHIRRMRRIYAEKRAALLEALHLHLGDLVEIQDCGAGLHIVARLPGRVDDRDVSLALRSRGYEVPALSAYSLLPSPGSPEAEKRWSRRGRSGRPKDEQVAPGGLLFGFTALDVDEMDGAVRRIRPVLDEAVNRRI